MKNGVAFRTFSFLKADLFTPSLSMP